MFPHRYPNQATTPTVPTAPAPVSHSHYQPRLAAPWHEPYRNNEAGYNYNYQSGRPGEYARLQHLNNNSPQQRGRGRGRGQGRGRFQRGGGNHWNNNNFQQFNNSSASQPGEKNKKSIFYCCSCERGFKTAEEQVEHNKEHIVCGLEGCQFEAHALVVTKHIRMQHEGGLYQRLKNLNTPDDINRWREERKKNFPTTEKVQQKVEEGKEKEKRREVCGPGSGAPFGNRPGNMGVFRYKIQQQDSNRSISYSEYQHRMRKLQYEQNDDWGNRKYAPDPTLRNNRVPFFSLNKSKVVTLENFYMSVKMGAGGKLKKEKKVKWKGFKVRKLERLEDSDSGGEEEALPISDEEDYYETPAVKNMTEDEKPATVSNIDVSKPAGLGLLLVDYSSASDSDNEPDSCEAVPKSSTPVVFEQPQKDAVNETLQSGVVGTSTGGPAKSSQSLTDDDDNYNSDASTQSMIIDELKEDAVFKSKPVYVRVGVKNKRKWMRTKLFETLLQDQIRKERNTILQACRFITENNFLDQ